MTVKDLFTTDEIKQTEKLCATNPSEDRASVVSELVVGPALPRINKVTGQENDSKYLAYALLHALGKA